MLLKSLHPIYLFGHKSYVIKILIFNTFFMSLENPLRNKKNTPYLRLIYSFLKLLTDLYFS